MYRPPHLRQNELGINLAPTTVDASEPSLSTERQQESPSHTVLTVGFPNTEETLRQGPQECPLGLEDDSFQEQEQDIPSRIEELRHLIKSKYEDGQVMCTIELMKACVQQGLPEEAKTIILKHPSPECADEEERDEYQHYRTVLKIDAR